MQTIKRCHICMRPYEWKRKGPGYCSKECLEKSKGRLTIEDNKRYCYECTKEYSITENYQMTCLECKDKFKQRQQKIQEDQLNQICCCCDKPFRRKTFQSSQTQCYACDKEKEKRQEIKNQQKNNIASMKENRRRGSGISLEELIRREEWKRVFDEKHANNYIRGRTR